MEKKYLLKLECSINGFAELIASGLPDGCTITKLDVLDAPLKIAAHKVELKQPEKILPIIDEPFEEIPQKEKVQKITGWDVYEIMREHFHPQRTFKSYDICQLALAKGFDQTSGAVSGHISRMNSVRLIERCGGQRKTGYVYRLTALRNKKDFTKLISGYHNKAKAKEQKKSAAKNGWFNLAEFQRQYNAN